MKDFIIAALCTVIVLTFFPQADIAVSRFFYNLYDGFLPKTEGVPGIIYQTTAPVVFGIILTLVILLFGNLLHWRPLPRLDRKKLLFLLLALALGPGLIVHNGFKDNWGRARPAQIQEFGGPRTFTPALVPANQCKRNCAFPSGHAAAGFMLLLFAFVSSRRGTKMFWNTMGMTGGLGIGFVRIIQGGHYLSDILFSGVVVYVTGYILYRLMIGKPSAI